jgi:hypothetical protein
MRVIVNLRDGGVPVQRWSMPASTEAGIGPLYRCTSVGAASVAQRCRCRHCLAHRHRDTAMLRLPTPLVLQLSDGQLLRWTQSVAVRLRVVTGRVWVTRPGDPDDHFLDAGDQLRLDARSRVLIGAEGEARLAVDAA